MTADVAIVGYGRTPYSRAKPDERIYSVDEYVAWAADLALKKAGMSKNDFDDQGFGLAHAEAAHTVNWSASTVENLGISPSTLIRADQGGASASAMLIRAAAMIKMGVIDRALIVGADTPLSIPSAAPGLPLSPERTRGVLLGLSGPVRYDGCDRAVCSYPKALPTPVRPDGGANWQSCGDNAISCLAQPGSDLPQAVFPRRYLDSRMLSEPLRLYDCVPIVNGGLAYIVTSAETARITHRQTCLSQRLRRSQQLLSRLTLQP